ncbi:MAG: zinc-binding dehydrogenase [Ancrocorticia sp.]|uniref:zinc-binding dehydrogenase n=1 Tax=Ancrocorticia sp. TaxID=2593684 RepID=UPI003F934702
MDTTDPEAVRELTGGLDLIINTVSAGLDLATYLGLLDVDGALVNVGAPAEPFSVPAFSLVPARRTLAGSTTGGIPEIEEMLAFCAEHGILPETELIGADRINEAYERVLASDVRYRFVIDASTFD